VQNNDMSMSDDDEPVQPEAAHAAHEDVIRKAIPTWDQRVFPEDGEPPSDVLLGELLLMYFEWMGTHKVTNECAQAAYKLMNVLMPPNANGGSWSSAQKMLQAIYTQSVLAVDICPNDCISFYDCKHPKLKHYQHSHRTWCPRCGADRHVTHADGTTRPAKQGYYLPCGTWFRDLYKIGGLGKELSTDAAATRPAGHVSKSRGWYKKVHINIHIYKYVHYITNICFCVCLYLWVHTKL
jgi:hypothetical protein